MVYMYMETEGRTGEQTGLSSIDLKSAEKKLPELTLTELSKSEPIIGEILDICPWNNYTIINASESNELIILDENSKKVENFTKLLGGKTIQVAWGDYNLLQKFKKNGSSPTSDMNIYQLDDYKSPFELKPFVKKLAAKDKWTALRNVTTSLSISKITLIPDNNILLTTPEGGFAAFVTKNENGIFLAPKDWKRVNPSETIPEDILKEAQKITKENDGFKQINDSYYMVITDVGINVFNNENDTLIFSENIPSVEKNVTIDPNNKNIVYFCQSSNPKTIERIDISGDPGSWKPVEVNIPQRYDNIKNFQLDPSGNFFLFYSKNDLVIITKDTLEEVKKVPNLSHVNFDASGNIRAIDKNGCLVIYEPNFGELNIQIEKQKIEKLANGVDIMDIFKKASENQSSQGKKEIHRLDPVRDKYQEQFDSILKNIENRENIEQVRQTINLLKLELKNSGLNEKEIQYIISGIEKPVLIKEKEFITSDTTEAIRLIEGTLDLGLSITSVSETKNIINKIKGSEALLDKDLRIKFSEITQKFDQKRLEFFTKQGDDVTKNLQGTILRVKTDLESFTSKAQMDDWLEFRYPELNLKFGDLARSVPVEAGEAYNAVMAIRAELQTIVSKREEQFKLEYGKIREKAVERTEAVVDTLKGEVDGFIERLKDRGFTGRDQAEQYLSSSEGRKALELEINEMAGRDPDLAKKMMASFKVKLSNVLSEIDRGGKTSIIETGQQMISFGETFFPKWEAKVKQKTEPKINIVFKEDIKSHGPGVKPIEFQGDISITIQNSHGKIDEVRLYQGWQEENEWRFGTHLYDRISLTNPPSYVTAGEFGKIKSEYSDWSKGNNSKLRESLRIKQESLKEFYKTRPKNDSELKDWINERDVKIKEYAEFYMKNHVPLLRRIDEIRNQPEIEHTNGKGFVPEWQSHWTTDSETEKNLERMAKMLKMQSDLKEGCLNLKGHAGVGKDVLIKMFSNLTNRPYFAFDGSKWTTEYELSEDVILESKDGASQTVKVPSIVLTGITTPGAVVYFNEFNAMPEQTQIFLHSLMDEKRSLTLKTSSGITVKSLPSILLISSMNPNYPGTFDIQFATKSRMVDLQIDYPPLTRERDKDDLNPNPAYNSSEALRMAREIDSLSDLTYEADIEHNDYVKMWDKYVNGMDNGSIEPNPTQRFDIDTSLAVIQFTNKLREEFIKYFEKTGGSRSGTLPVTQPITGRELRRIVWGLNQITPEQKATANPENIARELLDKFYLSHFDKSDDRNKIKTAMGLWTSQKRVKK